MEVSNTLYDENIITLSTPVDQIPYGDGGQITVGERLRAIEVKVDRFLDMAATKVDVIELKSRCDRLERDGSWDMPDLRKRMEANTKRLEDLEKATASTKDVEDAISRYKTWMLGVFMALIAIAGFVASNTLALHK